METKDRSGSMIGLGGNETLLRLRQGYHITMESGDQALEVMAVPRCETCRWWGPAGLCRLLSTRGTTRSQTEASVEDGSDLADARGHYGYGADFVTSADFGCVQWEGRK